MSSAHRSSASRVVTFSSEPIGDRCSTLRKPSAGGAPTRCVGESGVTSAGCGGLELRQLVEERVVRGCPGSPGRRGRGSDSCGARSSRRSSATRLAGEAVLEDIAGAPRASARTRRAPRRAASRRGGCHPSRPRRRTRRPPSPRGCRTASRRRIRPPRACRPRRSIAARTGSASGLCRSVSSCATTTSKSSSSAGKRSSASATVRWRFAVTMPSVRPSALRRGSSASTSSKASSVSWSASLCSLYASSELVDALGVDRLHLRDDPLASDGGRELLVGDLAAEHRRHACRIDARMIGPESISVPSRSKRTTRKRTLDRIPMLGAQ